MSIVTIIVASDRGQVSASTDVCVNQIPGGVASVARRKKSDFCLSLCRNLCVVYHTPVRVNFINGSHSWLFVCAGREASLYHFLSIILCVIYFQPV